MMKFFKKKDRTPKRKGRGTIGTIVLLLVASAGIRLVSSADLVLAATSKETKDVEKTETSLKPTRDEMSLLLKEFERREARIKAQEDQIAQRMRALEIADAKIEERLAQLKTAEQQLRATIALASTAAEDDLARLTSVYENMKPKTAAALFEEMAPEFAAGFLGRMRPDAAASVMAGMKPETAYTVSTILAGRNANVPSD